MGKKIILIIVIIMLLGGAGFYFLKMDKKQGQVSVPAPKMQKTTSPTAVSPAVEKRGDTTKTGRITQSGGYYFLTEAGASPKEIDSYAIDLADYVGQTVTVTGQYSGDTLFVGSIK